MKNYRSAAALAAVIGALALGGSQASASTFTDTISNGSWQISFGDDPAFTGSITISNSPTDTITAADVTVDGIPTFGAPIDVTFTTISSQGNRGGGGYQIDLTSGGYFLILDIASKSSLFAGSSTTFTDGALSFAGFQLGDNFRGNLSVSATPLPSAFLLFVGGLGALGLFTLRGRRKRRQGLLLAS